MWAYLLFAALLLLVAVVLAWHCEASWRAVRARELDDADRAFHRRRRWRRLGVAAIVALLAVAIPLSTLVGTLLIAEIYLFGLGVGLLLMFVLALLDLTASRAYFAREREKFAHARDELEADLKRLREQHRPGNGQAKS